MVGHRGGSEIAAVAFDQVLSPGNLSSSAGDMPFHPDVFGVRACCCSAIRLSEGFVPYLQTHTKV